LVVVDEIREGMLLVAGVWWEAAETLARNYSHEPEIAEILSDAADKAERKIHELFAK